MFAMDGMYRKGEYQKLLHKLNQITGSGQESTIQRNQVLQDQVNDLIESLRHRRDQVNAKVHYVLLVVPMVLIIFIHAFLSGKYMHDALVLILLVLALLLVHYRMGVSIKNSKKAIKNLGSSTVDEKQFIMKKLGYLEYALDIKKIRLVQVALMYILFFPVLLVKLYRITFGVEAFGNFYLAYGIGYALAGVFWFFYFNKSFELYDQIEEEARLIEMNL